MLLNLLQASNVEMGLYAFIIALIGSLSLLVKQIVDAVGLKKKNDKLIKLLEDQKKEFDENLKNIKTEHKLIINKFEKEQFEREKYFKEIKEVSNERKIMLDRYMDRLETIAKLYPEEIFDWSILKDGIDGE